MKNALTWKVYEYAHREKDKDWYWIVGISAFTIAVIALLLSNYLFVLIILLSTFSIMLFASRPPMILDVILNQKGITIHKHHFPFRYLECFHIEETENGNTLLLKSKKFFTPLISISLDGVDTEEVRKIFSKEVEEKFLEESAIQRVLEELWL